MRATVRIGLRTISVATIVMAAWLVAAIVSGRAARGQDLVALWSVVCAGSVALAWLTILATRPTVTRAPTPILSVALAVLGVAALVFGLFVLGAELTRAVGGEGYLFGLGLILAVHGLLATIWAGIRVMTPAS